MTRALVPSLIVFAGCSSSSKTTTPPWIAESHISVVGDGATNHDCRSDICKHNENTDLTVLHWRAGH